MPWITLTPDDLNEYLAAGQLKALRTKALASGQTDPLPLMIAEVARTLRNSIASAGWPLEATDGSLPQALKSAAAFLVIELAQTRLPGLSLTTEQKAQAAAARTTLKEIRARKVGVEMPVNPDYSASGVGTASVVRVVRSRKDNVSANDLKKLS